MLDTSDGLTLSEYLGKWVEFVFCSKAFSVEEQRMFHGFTWIDSSLDMLGGTLEVEDVDALRRGTLVATVKIGFDIELSGAAGLATFHRMIENDPLDVWGIGMLSGPGGIPGCTLSAVPFIEVAK